MAQKFVRSVDNIQDISKVKLEYHDENDLLQDTTGKVYIVVDEGQGKFAKELGCCKADYYIVLTNLGSVLDDTETDLKINLTHLDFYIVNRENDELMSDINKIDVKAIDIYGANFHAGGPIHFEFSEIEYQDELKENYRINFIGDTNVFDVDNNVIHIDIELFIDGRLTIVKDILPFYSPIPAE